MARPVRCQHEIEHVREDILHAAGRAFSRRGFSRVTIHDIAREAGYTTPSLYAYFKGKQEIIDALYAIMTREFESALDAPIPPTLGFPRRLGSLFERFLDIAERWPEARPLLLALRRSGLAKLDRAQKCAAKRSIDAKFVHWLKENMTSSRDLGGRKPAEMAPIIRSLIFGAFLAEGSEDARPSTPRNRFTLALQVCLYGITGLGKDGS